jgi:hypothetical protein
VSRVCRAVWQGLLQLSELFVVHDEERGGCFGDTGPASRVVMWNAPGWVVEKAGVVVAVVVVGDALESLASKTVAVRERCGCCRCC